MRRLEGHSAAINDVVYSPDGKLMATASSDQSVRLWDSESGALLQTMDGHQGWVTSVRFSPNGKFLVSGGEDHTTRLWRVRDAAPLAIMSTFRR
ncbi:hypothetical protein LP420_20485 [Massilia sp. B-10]|nr:hypothetical protein LP420_20485 [Massilia sp. B-10]